MKLNSQEAFNKTLFDQLNDIADRIENGITIDNIEYFDEALINALKITSADGSTNNVVYGSDATINSYQIRTVKQVLAYLTTKRIESTVVSFNKWFDFKGGEISVPIPEGYSGFNSFVSFDHVKNEFFTNGLEERFGISKVASDKQLSIKVKYRSDYNIAGEVLFWRYK